MTSNVYNPSRGLLACSKITEEIRIIQNHKILRRINKILPETRYLTSMQKKCENIIRTHEPKQNSNWNYDYNVL